jgi:hypothetical protein
MLSGSEIQVDHELHDVLVTMVREHGAQPLAWLVPRARRARRDARVDDAAVVRVIESSTCLVWLPDGRIDWLGRVLDGMVLTQRARAPLAERNDLWTGIALQPLIVLASYGALPLSGGGEVSLAESGQDVLVGPEGWLPDVPRFGLVALTWKDGELSAHAVLHESTGQELPLLQQMRERVAAHYRRERWWSGADDLESRPGELVRALTLARLEDPDFLTEPLPPLDELLYNPLEQEVDAHHWRDFAAARQPETVSFHLGEVPAALHMELSRRARLFGMSLDQFVIAVLGHLAWRTPFAEDCEPYDYWAPDEKPVVRDFKPVTD